MFVLGGLPVIVLALGCLAVAAVNLSGYRRPMNWPYAIAGAILSAQFIYMLCINPLGPEGPVEERLGIHSRVGAEIKGMAALSVGILVCGLLGGFASAKREMRGAHARLPRRAEGECPSGAGQATPYRKPTRRLATWLAIVGAIAFVSLVVGASMPVHSERPWPQRAYDAALEAAKASMLVHPGRPSPPSGRREEGVWAYYVTDCLHMAGIGSMRLANQEMFLVVELTVRSSDFVPTEIEYGKIIEERSKRGHRQPRNRMSLVVVKPRHFVLSAAPGSGRPGLFLCGDGGRERSKQEFSGEVHWEFTGGISPSDEYLDVSVAWGVRRDEVRAPLYVQWGSHPPMAVPFAAGESTKGPSASKDTAPRAEHDQERSMRAYRLIHGKPPDYSTALQLLEANIAQHPDAYDIDYDYGWATLCAAHVRDYEKLIRYYTVVRTRSYGWQTSGGGQRNWDRVLEQARLALASPSEPAARGMLAKLLVIDKEAAARTAR
jgi:hypothetical protein